MKFKLVANLDLEAESFDHALSLLATYFSRKANGHHVDNLGVGDLIVAPVIEEGLGG